MFILLSRVQWRGRVGVELVEPVELVEEREAYLLVQYPRLGLRAGSVDA